MDKDIHKLLISESFEDRCIGIELLKTKYPNDWIKIFSDADIRTPDFTYVYKKIIVNFNGTYEICTDNYQWIYFN